MTGIYKITSKTKPDRVYIGSAANIYNRLATHLTMLKQNKHHSHKLQRHYNKYGKLDLEFSIIICCDKESLITNEQFFIDSYKPYFNECPKAGNSLGYKHTKEGRDAISRGKKGKPSSFKNKKASEETRKKQSDAKKGKHLSPNTEFKKGMKSPRKGKSRFANKEEKLQAHREANKRYNTKLKIVA